MRAKRRPLTSEERAQKRQQMVDAWAAGKFAGRRTGMHRRGWTPEQDRALSALAGTRPVEEIATALEARFYIRRTEASLRIRAKRLGISLWQGGYGLNALERVFGVSHQTIIRHWIEPGHILGRRWQGGGPHAGWWFDPAEVERFVRECGWLYAVDRMKPGHPLTRLAETAHRADPWIVGLDALCPLLGLSATNVKKWLVRGLIPHKRRPGAGEHGELCVRGRDVPAIREAIRDAQRRARAVATAKFTAMRRGQLLEVS